MRSLMACMLLCVSFLFEATAVNAEVVSQPVTLVKNGVAQLPIVVGSVTAPGDELKERLKQMTGADFRIANAGTDQIGLCVGLDTDFPWLKVSDAQKLGEEGILLKSDGKSIYLIGHQPLGVQHAVTTFLHRLGYRWFFPGEVWEVIPKMETIDGVWNERHTPSFKTQRSIWYGFGAYGRGRQELADWRRHNRMGGPIEVSIGHTWHGLDPETDFVKHPEWFALVDGKRAATKPCYSHPEVHARAIRTALQQAARGKKMISMSPPDGLDYCECDRCLAVFQGGEPFAAHGTKFAKCPDGTLANVTSETLFAFVNDVATAVADKYPETLIGCYAYSAYSHPPSFELHPNVYLQTTTAFRRTPLSLKEQMTDFGKKTAQLGIREYYSVFQWDWDYPDPGKVVPSELHRDLRFFHEHGATAINAEASNNWAPRGLGYYVASQLMWNIDADVKEIIRDFYQQAFGPAAKPIERYYVRWYGREVAVLDQTNDVPEQMILYEKGTINVAALRAAFQDLDEARRLTEKVKGCRKRVDHLRMYAHYLILRYKLQQAEGSGSEQRILDAIRAETVYGGRLTNTNMLHSRPLIGKAFLRRFRKHTKLLQAVPEAQQWGNAWRQVGEPPSREELDQLWASDNAALGIK